MRINLFVPGISLATCLCYAGMVKAQTNNPDSAYLDLGRVKLKKAFTQNVTIKGADLQRFPFTNLSEAVNVWFSGNFTSPNNLVYVVDGKLLSDANQYSIYDIDEITLVQNAVAHVNGITQQQQLVLVKTKKNLTDKSGIEVAALTNLVQINTDAIHQYNPDFKTKTAVYQQYNLSAFKNIRKMHFGLSANYMRDVYPVKQYDNNTPVLNTLNTNKFRINLDFSTPLWKGSYIDVNLNTGPNSIMQKQGYISNNYANEVGYKVNKVVTAGSLNLSSNILPGLNNQLKAGYNLNNDKNLNEINRINFNPATTYNTHTSRGTFTSRAFLVNDELRYVKNTGNWNISPAINYSFRYIENRNHYINISDTYITTGYNKKTAENHLLTPSIEIGYKGILNVNAGVLYTLYTDTDDNITYNKKAYPFITATVNVTELASAKAMPEIKVYGSYALSNQFNDYYTQIINIASTPNYVYNSNTEGMYNLSLQLPNTRFKTFSLGTDIGLLKNKLTVSYNFESRKNFATTYIYNTTNYDGLFTSNAQYWVHRISAAFKLIEQQNITWQTALNTTTIKQDLMDMPMFSIRTNDMGKSTWTGGFVNRIQYKKLIGGIDMLYLFGKNRNAIAQVQNLYSLSLQNVYAGVQIKNGAFKLLEIYANGRNVLQNNKSVFTENRQYFGVGLKASI